MIAIEDVLTADGDDLLVGDNQSNLLDASGGDDTIKAGGGDDNLIGGIGNDELDGGEGNDVARITGSFVDYQFALFEEGFLITDSFEYRDGIDQVNKVEAFYFADQTITDKELQALLNTAAPEELMLSSNAFDENISAGSAITILSTIDADLVDFFKYSLVSGNGDSDNAEFTVVGDQLQINAVPDFEAKESYGI